MTRPAAVVDASVIVKWLLPEDGSEQAYRLQDDYQDGAIDLLAPELLVSEVGNVLWKRVRRGELSQPDAGVLFDGFLRDAPLLVNSHAAHRRAMQLSLEFDRPIYDCEYLGLALECDRDFITADQRLHAAVSAKLPWVKLLSESARP